MKLQNVYTYCVTIQKKKNTNKKIYGLMTDKQKDFFEALGIDILKIDMEEKIHDIPEDGELPGGRIYVRTLNFLFLREIPFNSGISGNDIRR